MTELLPTITVADALELPALRRGLPEVVAGMEALDRSIRWVHAAEVRNIASLLRGGELLLTTGMGIGARPHEQRRFIAQLAEANAAALVIERGDTFSVALPKALVAAAEHHGLPLVELHATVQFVAVTEAIHTEIVNQHYSLLRAAERLNNRFTTLMLQGAGLHGVLTVLAEALGNPVFLEAHDGRLLTFAAPPGVDADRDPVEAWTQAREDADTVGITVTVPADSGADARRLLALPLEAPLAPVTRLALERAAGIVALAFLRSRQEDELLGLGRGDLLAKLADGRIDPDVAAARARDLGFGDRRPPRLLPIAVRLSNPAHDLAPRDSDAAPRRNVSSAWTAALRDLGRDLTAIGVPTLVGISPREGGLLIILGLPATRERVELADRAATAIRRAARRRADAQVVVAVGPAGDWHGVGPGLRDAVEAAAVGSKLPGRPWFDATAMPLDRLLWRLRDNDDLARYVDAMLGRLIEHDERRKHTLMATLDALCAHAGRKAETARALHLNRQALYDRIGRLEQVLEVDLSDSQTLLALQLAILAKRHIAESASR